MKMERVRLDNRLYLSLSGGLVHLEDIYTEVLSELKTVHFTEFVAEYICRPEQLDNGDYVAVTYKILDLQ